MEECEGHGHTRDQGHMASEGGQGGSGVSPCVWSEGCAARLRCRR